ncbi:hypothetical protein FNJ87_10940 [Nonlabens mediterrranea]|uniref:DUF4412 domain-containing protein n=1 Tax=Nonlabens mediterrranea TaxID=1419947 RepID=A0ABS0A691_9FLAO|nr:hypothetical protein [Nonlabens mediterrranea]
MKNFLYFIALLSGCCATAQYEIVYNLEKGKSYPQNQVVTSEQHQVINGMPQDITTIITTESDYVVTDIKDEIYYLDIVVKKMSTETKSPMGTEIISSDGPESNAMNTIFKNMIKEPIKMTMNKHGEILSFDNSAQIEGLTDDVEMPQMQLLQVEAALKKEMSIEKQTSNYEQLTTILPKDKVAIGDSWNQTITVNSIAAFEATSSFQLKEVNEESYIISSNAILKTPDDASTSLNGMKASYTLSGPSSGTYTIDKKTGWITTASLRQELEGDIIIEKSEMMPQEMKMTMKTETTTIIN